MSEQRDRDLLTFGITVRSEITKSIGLNDTVSACAKLCRIARSLHRLYEAACNRELSKGETERTERLEAEAARLVTTFGAGFGLITNHDPRGVPLLVKVPSGYTNDFGERGVIVPL